MPALNLNDAGFALFLSKPVSAFGTDLSNATAIDALHEYEKFKRKSNPSFSLSSEITSIKEIQTQFGVELMPNQISDEFWMHYIMYNLMKGNVGSTCAKYCSSIIAVLKWGQRYNLRLSPTFDCYDKKMCKYEKTKVVLTPDDVSLIAHFDIMSVPYEGKDYRDIATEIVEKRRAKREAKAKTKYEKTINTLKKQYAAKKKKIERRRISDESKKSEMAALLADHQSKLASARYKLKSITDSDCQEEIESEITRLVNYAKWQHERHLNTLCRVRDQFVLQCNLGQRYSDICRIEPSCFSDDKNIYTCIQKKTSNKAAVNIRKFAFDRNVTREILERYGYRSPYPHDIGNFNKYLHELLLIIGGRFDAKVKTENKVRGEIEIEECEKWKSIASHTARRSFASYNVKRGIIEAEIRRATGHKDSKSFVKYIIYGEDDE